MIKNKEIQKCFRNIIKNYGIQCNLDISEPRPPCSGDYSRNISFIDMMTTVSFDIRDQEVLISLLQDGIKSKKDYRKLRGLVRMKIINALHSVQGLVEDGLRNLGTR